ncbi:MAG TPA: NAD-dependent epimerase/dehydratase family protein [Candidatus Acidoferrales bacterium]|nr:NAD-dependent epimerase/dehydratase family protein [Candidatus Acidoferrales bacterium]
MRPAETMWTNQKVLVTGGASFIGSHLVDQLLERGARVRIVDDLTSGRLENIRPHLANGKLEFIRADLREPGVTRGAVQGVDTVFHLAADHGGRGYVDLHQAGPASNFFLDGLVFAEALKAKVKKVVFASSGCVYPNFLQSDVKKEVYLTEELTKGPNDADNMYGWAKLMGEFTLQAYAKEHGLKAASCRYFTVYGPRGVENHAVIAMIARAFTGQDPFEVWGDGTQIRNWTYIEDIVAGTLLAGEKIDDGTAVNLGTMERVRVMDAVKMVLEYTGHSAEIKLRRDMPTGPLNRVADNSLAKKLLDWEPKTPFREGLRRTVEWYYKTKDREQVKTILTRMLTER